jgi:hypothetical protein
MINNKSNEFTRRILTSPAIRPCESVSPASLLASLINLGETICQQQINSFVVNKQKAREIIRLVRNLTICLEDIQKSKSEVSGAAILSLSELHYIFQKVQFLLQDCAREDARLWMLMNSVQVCNEFQSLIRAVGVAVDVMPLKSIDVSNEVKQLVNLVTRQAMKANIKLESDDERVMDEVHSVLSQFESRVVPEPKKLRVVLEYLGIRKWSECNREIKFLQGEIEMGNSSAELKDLELLSSLMAFMSLCRCVVFDVVDSVSNRQADSSSCSSEAVKCLNSDDFRCPISLEIMTDPVIISTGHTYDRLSILKWFGDGNQTCPLTGEKLSCTDLVPNLVLKNFIKQYCLVNEIPITESGLQNQTRAASKKDFKQSIAAEEAMKILASFLVGKLIAEANREINKAGCEIRLLTKSNNFNRFCLVEAGVIPNLLNLLFSDDSLIQENAMASLLNLSKCAKAKQVLVENSGLEMILYVVKNGMKTEARQHAAGALFYLASIEEYRAMIGEIPETFPSLVDLLKNGTDRATKNALVAIFGLVQSVDNQWRALATGIVPLLVNILASSQRDDITTDCLAVLATLAEKRDGASAILSTGALHVIVESLTSSNSRIGKEYCVSLLLALCVNGGTDAVLHLVKNPSVMRPLYAILTGGTGRASKKASSLIRILQEFNDKSSSGLGNPSVHRERFVHVW